MTLVRYQNVVVTMTINDWSLFPPLQDSWVIWYLFIARWSCITHIFIVFAYADIIFGTLNRYHGFESDMYKYLVREVHSIGQSYARGACNKLTRTFVVDDLILIFDSKFLFFLFSFFVNMPHLQVPLNKYCKTRRMHYSVSKSLTAWNMWHNLRFAASHVRKYESS